MHQLKETPKKVHIDSGEIQFLSIFHSTSPLEGSDPQGADSKISKSENSLKHGG